jgi:hydrogenase maturation factor
VESVSNLNPYEVLNSGDLVFFQNSIGKLRERLTKERKIIKVVKPVKAVKKARLVRKSATPVVSGISRKRKAKSKK